MAKIKFAIVVVTIPILLLILTAVTLNPVDKSSINSAVFVFENLPLYYYFGYAVIIALLAYTIFFSKTKLSNNLNIALYIMAILLFSAYLEMPRLLYTNTFQTEYFHQAQVYHVANYGVVTDPGYSFPKSDVSHAITAASLALVSGVNLDFIVGNLSPLCLKFIMVLLAALLVTSFGKNLQTNCKIFLMTIPLFVIVCDTELLATNHYAYALPLYMMLIFLLLKKGVVATSKSGWLIMLSITTSTLIITHIYFATVIIAPFLVVSLINQYKGKLVASKPVTLYLSLGATFGLWHGIACDWSLQSFVSEYSLFSRAFTSLISGEIIPFAAIDSVQDRYGSIPVIDDYFSFFMLKWSSFVIMIALISIIVIVLLLYNRKNFAKIKNHEILYFSLISIICFLFFVGTYTAHIQRISEHLVITFAGLVTLLLFLIGHELNHSRIQKILLVSAIIIFALTPFKLVTYWGTSLTYMGLSEKSIDSTNWLASNTENPISQPICFVGSTPYWLLTDIVSTKQSPYVISLNGPDGSEYFNDSLNAINASLSKSSGQIILVDLTNDYSLRAKYQIEPYIDTFINDLNSLNLTVVYTSGKMNFIAIAPTNPVSLHENV